MTDFKTLKLYAQNRKLPKAVKLGTVSDSWTTYANTLAKTMSNTSDIALAQREALGIKGTEVDNYNTLTEFYNQRYCGRLILPNEIEKLDGVSHLRFGVLAKDAVIPMHLDEPYTLRFLCIVNGSHNFEVETGEVYHMTKGELWFVNGSYKHSIKNTTDGERIALLGKYERSSSSMRRLNELL